MSRYVFLALLLLVLPGCPKKDDKAAADAAPAASTSAAPQPTDTATAAASAAPATPQAAALAAAPPNVPGISTDPNAPPSHEDHDKTATLQVHKGNYKSEMDKLEKEDLSADKK